MRQRTRRTLETLHGVGEVFQGETQIAKADYEIVVEQEVTVDRVFGGESETPGLKSANGEITVTQGERLELIQETLTLHLADGRQAKFWIKGWKGSPMDTYEIKITGPIE